MPFHLNKVMLSGTLTREPEVKFLGNGTAVGQVSLAINRVWFNDKKEKQEETCFVEVTLWGKKAETVGDWCHKGDTIFVEGRLKLDQWEDKQTQQKRSKLSVTAENFSFVAKPKDREEAEASQREDRPRRPAPQKHTEPDPDLDQPEDDIPF